MTEEQRELALQYAHKNKDRNLSALKEILMIPSISTDPAHAADIRHAAEWMASQLRNLGMQKVQLFPTAKHPIVYGEWLSAQGAPTVLLYGHYDVQPADPRELWKTAPFEPTVRDDDLFARGASDMKGQVVATLKAVEALVKNGGMPINIKWLLEGEEEIGSPNLEGFIQDHADLLASDLAFNPDSGMIGKDYPTITYALRGLAYFEIYITGPEHDLHSGIFGGIVHNPAQVLAGLIAGMQDEKGRITLPGFYDKVRKLSKEEREELGRLPTTDAQYREQTGVPALFGEAGYTTSECTGARPTLDVNGLLSGFTGPGSKTIIPSKAMAKVSMRLVPDQDPKEVHEQLLRYMESNAPKDVRWEVIAMAGSPASISDRQSTWVQAMAKALETVWGTRPYYRREGGSIPVVAQMQHLLKLESVISGFGLPDDNIHAPNEKLNLTTWYRGIDAIIHFFMNIKNR